MTIDIAKYKKLLETELKKLEGELLTVGIKNSETGDWEAKKGEDTDVDESDRDTVADGIEGYETNVAILEDLEIRNQEVKSALEKIKKGNYGICEKCGKQIEEARLSANPAAKTCIVCSK